MTSRSTPLTLAVACLAVLAACTSNPSSKAVTRDMIESLDEEGGTGVDAAAKECMLEKVDAMSNDELDTIGEANPGFLSSDDGAVDAATPEMQAFIDDLRACLSDR